MISLARLHGGCRKVDVAGTTVDVHLHVAKCWAVNATASNSKVRLPSWTAKLARRSEGFDPFYLFGVGSNGFDVVDSAGNNVLTGVASTGTVLVFVSDRSGIGGWTAYEV